MAQEKTPTDLASTPTDSEGKREQPQESSPSSDAAGGPVPPLPEQPLPEQPLPEQHLPDPPLPIKGVGFLGRRGTAPVRTVEAPPLAEEARGAEWTDSADAPPATHSPEHAAEHSPADTAPGEGPALPTAEHAAASTETSADAGSESGFKTDAGEGTPIAPQIPELPEDGAEPVAAAAPYSPPPPRRGMAEHAFIAMSYLALIFLVVLLGMQTAAGIYFPSAFWPAETALAEVYELMSQSGQLWQWLVPPPTAALPAALPGYFWFMGAVDMVPGLDNAFFLPVVAALSALVALLGTYMLGLCTGLGNRVAFAGGLILLSSLGFVPLTHWLGPDMLLAGLLAFSLAFLHRGWVSDMSFLWLSLGFVLAGLAALVGGLPALWIPLITSMAFIFWRGTLRRAQRLDAVFGFMLLLLCMAGWLGGVILLTGESAQVLRPLSEQLVAPLMPPLWPPKDPWWLGLALLPLSLLPWILIPLFVPWGRVLFNAWPSLVASRKENSGAAWLWISLVAGVLLLVASSIKPWFMAVPLLPMAALLLAKALLGLSYTRSRLFYLLLALLCLLGGAALTMTAAPAMMQMAKGYLSPVMTDILLSSAGLPVMGGVLLLAALVLSRFTNRAYPGGALAVVVLLIVMLVQPATLLTAPSLVGRFAVTLPKGMGLGTVPHVPGLTPAQKAEPAKPETVKSEPATAEPAAAPAPAEPKTEKATPASPEAASPEAASPEAATPESAAPAPAPAPVESTPAPAGTAPAATPAEAPETPEAPEKAPQPAPEATPQPAMVPEKAPATAETPVAPPKPEADKPVQP